MCNVDQHASIVDLHYLPLFAFHAQRVILSYGVIGIAKFLFWRYSKEKRIEKLTENIVKQPKSQKRIRQKYIKVILTEEEKKQIEESAAQGNLSASQYLRDLGLGYEPKSLTDVKMIQEIRSLKSDMNKVGSLLKNLMTGELTDPKEIRSRVNGLLLDFSKNQNSLDILITKVRSQIKF
jgi:hypothetical protein